MPWWGWMIIGAMLLGAELAIVDLEFFLVLIGVSAIIVGFTALADIGLPLWGEWLLFAGLSLVLMVFFRQRVYKWMRPEGPGYQGNAVGKSVKLPADLAPGESCRIEHRGSTWTARNESNDTLRAGEMVTVESVESTVLKVGKRTES